MNGEHGYTEHDLQNAPSLFSRKAMLVPVSLRFGWQLTTVVCPQNYQDDPFRQKTTIRITGLRRFVKTKVHTGT